jgi:hypothetical protein
MKRSTGTMSRFFRYRGSKRGEDGIENHHVAPPVLTHRLSA